MHSSSKKIAMSSLAKSYAKQIKSAQEMSRRFLGHVNNPAQVQSGRKVFKQNRFNYSSYYIHTQGVKPFDVTGLFLTRIEQDRIESYHEMKITGRGAPKKGQGKQSQMASKGKKK
jgi:hypothetical protein